MGPSDTINAPPTILVVEDNEAERDLLRRMLARAGYQVETAIHGAEGLRLFRASRFDLVVTDILMPEMDGFELMRALRAEKPDANFVAISGMDDQIDFLRMAIKFGAKAAFRKPIAPQQLVTLVGELLATAPPPQVLRVGNLS